MYKNIYVRQTRVAIYMYTKCIINIMSILSTLFKTRDMLASSQSISEMNFSQIEKRAVYSSIARRGVRDGTSSRISSTKRWARIYYKERKSEAETHTREAILKVFRIQGEK